MQRSIQLNYINPFLTCTLCTGYLVDATTIVECLHSFCRSCIIRHLEISYNCPKCTTEIHKTKPFEYIRSDPCLQEVVYKLVPDLYSREDSRKNIWKKKNNEPAVDNTGDLYEDGEEDSRILVTLKYFRGTSRMERIKTERVLQMFPTRYLCCQPEMPVRVLKKFVRYKFDISAELFSLEMWRGDETLLDDLTLKQLVQIYGLFRERKPLDLHYSIYPKFEIKEEVETTPQTPLPRPQLQSTNEAVDGVKEQNDLNNVPTGEEKPIKEESENSSIIDNPDKKDDQNESIDNKTNSPTVDTIKEEASETISSLSNDHHPPPSVPDEQQQIVSMDTEINSGQTNNGVAENELQSMDES